MNEMYHITADKQKRKYSYVSNAIYFMKQMKAWDKGMFYCLFLQIIPQTLALLFGDLLPASLVQGLEKQGTIAQILTPVFLIAMGMLVLNIISSIAHNYYYQHTDYLPGYFSNKFAKKVVEIDYERLEDKNYKEIKENAWTVARNGQAMYWASDILNSLFSVLITAATYGIILASRSVWILLAAFLSIAVNLYLLGVARKMHGKYFGKISKYSKGEAYISERCVDSAAGKDIRIYRMLDYILGKYDENLEKIGGLFGKIHNWYLFRNLSGAVLEFARDSLVFLLLGYYLTRGSITAAEFVFYIGIFSGFSKAVEQVLRSVMQVNSVNTSISYFREFEETESMWRKDKGAEADNTKAVKLELRNVTFTYQGNEEATIKNINLTITPGEKLALIGLNGAGKTTLVKLICGLYMPEQGEILLNDRKMEEYNREDYMSLISVLFQDSTLLPLSIDENITGQEKMDRKRLEKALKLSGFWEKYQSLPQKGATKLVKKVEDTAVDFSGGEKQKLLFARALYKQAPLVILDEPTAALDPIAENELYMNLGASMENRTSIYISHRLSSTRFCDRIILLEHGQVIEEGTHEGLLAAGGRYAALYDMQSQYYKDEEERKKRSAAMGDEHVEGEKGGIFHE